MHVNLSPYSFYSQYITVYSEITIQAAQKHQTNEKQINKATYSLYQTK